MLQINRFTDCKEKCAICFALSFQMFTLTWFFFKKNTQREYEDLVKIQINTD